MRPSGKVKVEQYWTLDFSPARKRKEDLQELCDQIRTGLEESVNLRLISDVPLGAFLSGGIDSSIIVGLMAKRSASPVKTFSIGFDEAEFDELSYARIISERFATEHHEFVVRPNAIEILNKLVWHYNEPFADSSAIPTYYVAKDDEGFCEGGANRRCRRREFCRLREISTSQVGFLVYATSGNDEEGLAASPPEKVFLLALEGKDVHPSG